MNIISLERKGKRGGVSCLESIEYTMSSSTAKFPFISINSQMSLTTERRVNGRNRSTKEADR